MCATDLDLDPDITEDEPMLDEIIGQHPGVAWGRAGCHDQDPHNQDPHDQDPAPADAGAGAR
jgi:hypothetical protein